MDGFEHLREALDDELWDADDEDIFEKIDEAELLEDVAGALRAAGKTAQVASGVIQARGPDVLRGAVTGMLVGGPAGAAAGAIGGAAGVSGRGGVALGAPAAPDSAVAAASLLLAMLRPEVVQALVALAAGQAGVSTVPVAGVQVPIAAFANMIESLAATAGRAHAAPALGIADYLREAAHEGLDIRSAPVKAFALLTLLADAAEDDAEDDDDRYEDCLDAYERARNGDDP